jgi:hypothetical protein
MSEIFGFEDSQQAWNIFSDRLCLQKTLRGQILCVCCRIDRADTYQKRPRTRNHVRVPPKRSSLLVNVCIAKFDLRTPTPGAWQTAIYLPRLELEDLEIITTCKSRRSSQKQPKKPDHVRVPLSRSIQNEPKIDVMGIGLYACLLKEERTKI